MFDDPLAEYPTARVFAVIESDPLANLVTGLGGPQVLLRPPGINRGCYVCHQMTDSVYMYINAEQSGWVGGIPTRLPLFSLSLRPT